MIRKVYTDLMLKKIKEAGPGWLMKRCLQYLLLHLSGIVRRPLAGPALGTIMVTYRCNLHCSMCDLPMRAKDHRKELGTEGMKDIISGFRRLGTPGIGFTGGEPLLRHDIFELLAYTKSNGMISHLNTNGILCDDDVAERIIKTGVDSVNVSLDGATAATHDLVRCCGGAFEKALAAVRRLVHYKKTTGSTIRIKTVAVVDEKNIHELGDMIRLNRELEADCIEFIPRQPFTSGDTTCEGRDEKLLEDVKKAVFFLLKERRKGMVENSPLHLDQFLNSFSGLPSPVRCYAAYNSLAVDCYGELFPCVPWINWKKSVGNLESTSMEDFWYSSNYQNRRLDISACRSCYLNCHLEMNLLFDLKWRVFRC